MTRQAKDALVWPGERREALLARWEDGELDEQAASAVALLALVAGQDVEPAEGSDGTDGRWRIARKVAGDRVISTVTLTRGTPVSRRRTAATGTAPTWPPARKPG